MKNATKRTWQVLLGVVVATLVVFVFGKWRDAGARGGQAAVEPFRIAGNLYYVGTNDVTAFLITGPEGDVLIGDGRELSAPLIINSIAALGFKITDVKVLLNSNAAGDHAGALTPLQNASGAQLWISDRDADVVAAGGEGNARLGVFIRFATYLGALTYHAPRIDHRFKDGETIHLGPIAVTGHDTGEGTSWSFPVHDDGRDLLAVVVCDLDAPAGASRIGTEAIRADYERSFETLRRLPADIFLASHARAFGRWRKLQLRPNAKQPADPFIDPDGYRRFIDDAEAQFRAAIGK